MVIHWQRWFTIPTSNFRILWWFALNRKRPCNLQRVSIRAFFPAKAWCLEGRLMPEQGRINGSVSVGMKWYEKEWKQEKMEDFVTAGAAQFAMQKASMCRNIIPARLLAEASKRLFIFREACCVIVISYLVGFALLATGGFTSEMLTSHESWCFVCSVCCFFFPGPASGPQQNGVGRASAHFYFLTSCGKEAWTMVVSQPWLLLGSFFPDVAKQKDTAKEALSTWGCLPTLSPATLTIQGFTVVKRSPDRSVKCWREPA